MQAAPLKQKNTLQSVNQCPFPRTALRGTGMFLTINLYLQNKLYYVPAGLGKGSINLVSGFEHTKYLLLHDGSERTLLEIAAGGPKFFTATTLKDMGFDPSGEYYLGFELKSPKPITIDGCDLSAVNLRTKGNQSYRPYFITLKELFRK